MAIEFGRVVPTFRIFSLDKAREFYEGFLGCTVDWEHRFEPDAPVYMQVSRGNLVLHLSEHHGDATPGSIHWDQPELDIWRLCRTQSLVRHSLAVPVVPPRCDGQ